ncbi:MAG TPA: plastocyanin/azurin family copper-binding protein [Xanthomonadales bacterium]|nr:plastocyanin/azurin family copper-binding protein [Xanthomonadales bacterium]
MKTWKTAILTLGLTFIPATLLAQTTHTVMVNDNVFVPADITIQTGDTVRWVNDPGGNAHNVIAEDFSFSSGALAATWTFEKTFTEAGEVPYYCQPHRNDGMTGNVTVVGDSVGGGVDINPGHSGNWWSGLIRDGEGVQIEVSIASDGSYVFVATVYSYGPQGGQIFLIGVGTPDGDTVEADVFITEGGVWGDDLDPDDIDQIPWGSAVFVVDGCDSVSLVLTPNSTYASLGYTVLALDLVRLTTPDIACPYEE